MIPAVWRTSSVEQGLKRFYQQFKNLLAFLGPHVQGVVGSREQEAYALLTLQRVFVLYFLQKQGLLDGDDQYLMQHLRIMRKEGAGCFFRQFWLPLCHERLAGQHNWRIRQISGATCHRLSPPVTTCVTGLDRPVERMEGHLSCMPRIGVPLSPGGISPGIFPRYTSHVVSPDFFTGNLPFCDLPLFAPHILEHTFPQIIIADEIFERIFLFCEQYDWCADHHPSQQRELHPDIFAYICEQQCDQKQIGAYYTANDVALYIANSTIIPSVLSSFSDVGVTAVMGYDPWQLLAQKPERYILPAVRCAEYLPAETEREYLERRQRYEQLLTRLKDGQVRDMETLVSCHVDLRCFAVDVIQSCPGPSGLLALYAALENLTVLDPTCGSGAFLIAALEILATLYVSCLERMTQLVAEEARDEPALAGCRRVLEQARSFYSHQHFALTQVVTRNLYGVELVEEASEMCRLRLYLAVLAHTTTPEQVPLFSRLTQHIRTGNALCGAIRKDEPISPHLVEKRTSEDQLHVHLSEQTAGVFHWYQQFPHVLAEGGFHVILGNPPYIEYSKTRREYLIEGYEQRSCGNLYAAVLERSLALCRSTQSYLGLVVPLSICSGWRFAPLRAFLREKVSALWLANFEIFPSRLFAGAYQRLSLLLAHYTPTPIRSVNMYTTRIHRWYSAERSHVLELMVYTHALLHQDPCIVSEGTYLPVFPKLASTLHQAVLRKVVQRGSDMSLADVLLPYKTQCFLYYQEATNYWMKVVCRVPFYKKDGIEMPPPHGRFLFFETLPMAQAVMALMNSSLFYVWFASYADGFHINQKLVATFPIGNDLFILPELPQLAQLLEADIRLHTRPATRNSRPDSRQPKVHAMIELEEFQMSCSKPLLDAIDHVLAAYYGFDAEELDFIIHYDFKYRMGRERK